MGIGSGSESVYRVAEWARFSGECVGTAILEIEPFRERLGWRILGDFEEDEIDVVRPVDVRDVVEPNINSECVAVDSLLVYGLVEDDDVLLPPSLENRPPPWVEVVVPVRCISAGPGGLQG